MNTKSNKHNIFFFCLMVLATWFVGACDDETMGGETLLGFPADTLFVATPGEEVDVTFNVGYDWNITSDKEWCKVDGEYKNTRGKAGKSTVTFVVSEFGNLFAADTAAITLYMNDDSRVIARIVRNATKKYTLTVKNGERVCVAGETIEIGVTGKQTLSVELNFGVDQLRYTFPEWVKMEREEKNLTLSVAEESLKYAINNSKDSLCVYKDSTLRQSFHLQYTGMSPREIRIGSKIEETLIVSQDAKKAFVGEEKYSFPLKFSVSAFNDQYEIVTLGYTKDGGCYVLSDDESWFTAYGIGGIVELSKIKENEGLDRTMHLLALPQEIADSLDSDEMMLAYLCEDVEGIVELKEDAEQYRMVTVSQDGVANITIIPEAQWGVKVTSDGKGYHDVIKGDTCYSPMEVEIETHRGYELVCASYDLDGGCKLMDLEDSWLDIKDDKKGKVSIEFMENMGNERTLYLFALPLPIVENLKSLEGTYQDNLSNELFENIDGLNEVKVDAEKYVVAKFLQEANEGNAIKVYTQSWSSIEVVKETDPQWLEIAAHLDTLAGVAPNKVFHCEMMMGFSYTINPLFSLDEWGNGGKGFQEDKRGIEIYGKSGKKYEPGNGKDYDDEYGMMEEIEGDYMLVTLTGDADKITEDFIIYFVDSERGCLKALVVTLF